MWKRDEMEQGIYDKSARITWQITIIVMLIYGWYYTGATGESNFFIFIASLSMLLQTFLDRFYFSKVTDKKNFFKFVGKVLIVSFILISVTMWLIR